MSSVDPNELVFEVTEEPQGGYSAECLSENIFTQGETWQDLRANVNDAVKGFFFDGRMPPTTRLLFRRGKNAVVGRDKNR